MTASLDLRRYVRDVPDFPRKGILFKDITPLLLDPAALSEAIRRMADRAERPQAVVAIESRGFIFGTGLALHWNVPFVPARKFGKLPGRTVRQVYSLEYGEDTLELHADALRSGQTVAIVDDLLEKAMTHLNERERHILAERRLKDNPTTLEDLSQQYGISRERVRQIESRALEKLRRALEFQELERTTGGLLH